MREPAVVGLPVVADDGDRRPVAQPGDDEIDQLADRLAGVQRADHRLADLGEVAQPLGVGLGGLRGGDVVGIHDGQLVGAVRGRLAEGDVQPVAHPGRRGHQPGAGRRVEAPPRHRLPEAAGVQQEAVQDRAAELGQRDPDVAVDELGPVAAQETGAGLVDVDDGPRGVEHRDTRRQGVQRLLEQAGVGRRGGDGIAHGGSRTRPAASVARCRRDSTPAFRPSPRGERDAPGRLCWWVPRRCCCWSSARSPRSSPSAGSPTGPGCRPPRCSPSSASPTRCCPDRTSRSTPT